MPIDVASASDVGRVREHNEDSCYARDDLALVADGMGGHAAGDVASRLAVEQFQSLPRAATQAQVLDAIRAANDAILGSVAKAAERSGMGTTLVGLASVSYGGSSHWLVFNIGDSRAYRVRDGAAQQLTTDHSAVAELLAEGRITPDEVRTHPLRSVVTRSLGTDPAPIPDTWTFPPSSGAEAFVLCSDGLTNEVADDRIAEVVSGSPTARDACLRLVDEALANGGRDNVTVVVLISRPDEIDDIDVATVPRETPS